MSAHQASSGIGDDRFDSDAPAQPLRILLVVIASLVLGVGAAGWLDSTGKPPVAGFLQVRTTFVTAERCARVVEWRQQEGDRVTIGDALITCSDTELEERIASTRKEVEQLTRELAQAEARARLETVQCEQDLEDRICQVKLQASDYRQSQHESEMRRSLLADLLASHQTALWDSGESLFKSFVLNQPWPDAERMQTVLQMESYADQSDLLSTNIEICESRINSLEALKEKLPEQIRQSCGVPVAALRLEQTQQELTRLESRQTQLCVTSPAVGWVGVYRSRPGDVLQPGDPIVELLDDSRRYLVAKVPSTRINEFKVGRTVVLNFPGRERRQGRITRIAPQAAPRDDADVDADPLVDVDIEQAGRLWPHVPSGTRVDVYVDQTP